MVSRTFHFHQQVDKHLFYPILSCYLCYAGDVRALVGIAVESVKFAVKELLKEHGVNVNSLQQCKVHIVDIFFRVPIT